jgi:transcriptional regulator with XRE-family HTH domain
MTSQSPRARFLGAELRDARTRAKVGVRQLAKILDVQHAKVSHWENGKRIPTTEDVASYLTAIGVTGDERDRLLDMARTVHQPNWLAAGIPGIRQELAALMEFERTAQNIMIWAPLLIPGLLQTGDYARAVMGASPSAGTRVAMRLGRRDILTRRNPVQLTAVMSEGALRQPIAEPDMMADQLDHLVDTAERSNVTVQVIPSRTGWHAGLAGPFVLLEFPKAKPIVHLEHHRASVFLFDDDDVTIYVDVARTICCELAMTPDESLEFIRQTREEIRRDK